MHGNDETEFAASHAFQLSFEALCVATEHLDHLRVLDAVEQLDSLAVVHHTGNRSVQRLRAQGCPNASAQSELWCRSLEANRVERNIICFRAGFLVFGTGGRGEVTALLSQDLGVSDKVGPFDGVQLLEVFQERDAGVLVFFSDDLSE